MYQLKMPLKEYEKMKECLAELHPEIDLELISCDYALATLGFAESPPCAIHVSLTREQMDILLDELDMFDMDTGIYPEWSLEYQKARKYAWMWPAFSSAEWIG